MPSSSVSRFFDKNVVMSEIETKVVVEYLTMQNGLKGAHSIRWAVNINDWIPTQQEWIKAMRCIQPIERQRIRKFRYRKDAKASIVGRLLMRFWASKTFNMDSNLLEFNRTKKGRPYLRRKNLMKPSESENDYWDFNVSHAGNYTVFVAEKSVDSIGVDVMSLQDIRFDRSDEKIQDFFRIMTKQFTESEWNQIKCSSPPSQTKSLATFFRFWTLKESFVKADGEGLAWDLQRLSFQLLQNSFDDKIICDSELSIDRQLVKNWHFQESLLDPDHWVSTALKISQPLASSSSGPRFKYLICEDILNDLLEIDFAKDDKIDEWKHFLDMVENKPF